MRCARPAGGSARTELPRRGSPTSASARAAESGAPGPDALPFPLHLTDYDVAGLERLADGGEVALIAGARRAAALPMMANRPVPDTVSSATRASVRSCA